MGIPAPARPVWRRVATALGAVLLAVLCAGVLLEVVLRLLVWRERESYQGSGARGGRQTVVCFGDSWTVGYESGDPKTLSYPAQLQQILDARLGRGKVRVVNRGEPGLTSSRLLQRFGRELDALAPSVVLALIGGANWLNLHQVATNDRAAVPASRRSFLDELRVVRLARLLLGGGGEGPGKKGLMDSAISFDPSRRVRIVRQLQELLQEDSRWPAEETRGVPPLTFDGCDRPAETEAQALAASRGGAGGIPELERLLEAQPRCLPVALLGAQLCRNHDRLDCAERFARAALKIDPREPRASLHLALALHQKHGDWSKGEALEMLYRLAGEAEGFLKARRQLVLALAESEDSPCKARDQAERVLATAPDCAWAKQVLKIMREELDRLATRALWPDLAQIAAICREREVKLLVLAYPGSEGDPCRAILRDQLVAFARTHGVELLPLEPVIGPHRPTHDGIPIPSATYAEGGHPNSIGYHLIARRVYERLAALGWVR